MARAQSLPVNALIALATRVAVVKSGLRSDRRIWFCAARSNFSSRSITAPLGMRPPVGMLRVSDEPDAPPAVKAPTATDPCATA